jgi:hypothetical protein
LGDTCIIWSVYTTFMKVSMRCGVLWTTLRSIYVVVDFNRLGRLSVLKWHYRKMRLFISSVLGILVRPWVGVMLVLLKPTWILQIFPRVRRVVCQTRPQVLQAFHEMRQLWDIITCYYMLWQLWVDVQLVWF